MTRIRQIRDVVATRQQEDRERSLTYKEIEVRTITGAIHSAAGNKRGAKAASQFRFHKAKAQEITTAQASRMFPITEEGLISQEEIDAAIAKLLAAETTR